MSISFPLAGITEDLSAWGSFSRINPRTPTERPLWGASIKVGGAGVFVGATAVDGRLWGKVEGNPARVHDGDGCSLLPMGELVDVAGEMFAAAGELVRPACDVGDALMRRTDVARDFRGVSDPALYVHGLLPIKRPHARRSYVYSDPGKNRAQTLWAGNNTRSARLYDQFEAYADKGAPVGSVRAEVELRRDALVRAGVVTVADATEERLERLLLDGWEWSRFGHAVGSGPAVMRRLESLDISAARRQRLLGILVEECLGGAPKVGKDQETRYRRMKDALGLVPSPDLLLDLASERRLDFVTGKEVAA